MVQDGHAAPGDPGHERRFQFCRKAKLRLELAEFEELMGYLRGNNQGQLDELDYSSRGDWAASQ